MHSLNCKGRLLLLETPVVMGILNRTPDSFYAGSRMESNDQLIQQAGKMLTDGAAILDIGGMSTRPGADEISVQEELDRVIPAIESLTRHFPQAIISIDSYRYPVTKAALDAGASVINDIGAGKEGDLAELAATYEVPYICMHMRGDPKNMQSLTKYEDITREVLDFFIRRTAECVGMGVKDIIVDPGFGFAKTISQNFKLLKEMHVLSMLGFPVMAGLSRKSTVYRTLDISPEDALNGTTVLHTLALTQGASILRVHDVKEAVEAIRLWTSYSRA